MTKAKTELLTLPFDQNATGRTLGDDEITALKDVIDSGTLTSTKGSYVKKLSLIHISEPTRPY